VQQSERKLKCFGKYNRTERVLFKIIKHVFYSAKPRYYYFEVSNMARNLDNPSEIKDLAHNVIEGMPSMVFLMDEFPMIVGMNSLAKKMAGLLKINFYQKRCGELFHCVNSSDPESCGTTEACKTCPIRDIYENTQTNGGVIRRRVEMTVCNGGGKQETRFFVVTSYKIEAKSGGIVTLIVDDISELLQIKSFIPICTSCKKIKDDDHVWKKLEDYFRLQGEIVFSHCLCPDCLEKVCPDINMY
jgi:hypothetical protein